MEHNLARALEAVESAVGGRDCVVTPHRRVQRSEFGDESRRCANHLLAAGLGRVVPRRDLAGHESGQDHLALCLHNSVEFLEALAGAWMARVVPFNVNIRYTPTEVAQLLTDAAARGVVFHSAVAPVVAEALGAVGPRCTPAVLLQVPDASGHALLPGALWWDDALAASAPTLPDEVRRAWSPDDLYLIYTGGTTGAPKGVLWRQADIFVRALGGRRPDTDEEWASVEDLVEYATRSEMRLLPAAPFLHGTAQWTAVTQLLQGGTVVLPEVVDHLDVVDLLRTAATEDVNVLVIVGDAVGRPLAETLEAVSASSRSRLSSLVMVASGGAALSAGVTSRLLDALPTTMVLDGLGASEAGQQARHVSAAGVEPSSGVFTPGPGTCVLDEDRSRELPAGHDGVGWLAQRGRVPLGYLGDPTLSAVTFPTLGGVRYSVPGDRARLAVDGSLHLLGRDSSTINTGGEKVFAEEVEAALLHHPAVLDCVVSARPSARWGQEVVAVVHLAEGEEPTDDELLGHAGRHLARYKLPKAIVRRDRIARSDAGKVDHRWAAEQVALR